MHGGGLVNSLINNLPFELHLPGYNYCGPGTKLVKRLARGDKGINILDNACMHHDIAYTKFSDLENRHKADLDLLNMAKQRLRSKDAKRGEKIASWLVNKVMKTKLKIGSGVRHFKAMVSKIKGRLQKLKPKNCNSAIQIAYAVAKKLIDADTKRNIRIPRIIPLPKHGGFLPLIPIFAGLSALGSLAGGAAGIAKSVNDYKTAQESLRESKRHNRKMESISVGQGLYIKPYKKGSGLFIKSKN